MKKLIILITLFLSLTSPVFATSTITAIPPRLELFGKPGETLTATIKVRNDSDTLVNYSVLVEDFIVADNKGTPLPVVVPNSRWSLKQWIAAPSFVPVDPSTTQSVNLTIKIPKAALPGGHFAMVLYTPSEVLKAGDQKKTASAITQRVGTLLYVTVEGKINESAAVSRFSIPKLNEYGPVEIRGLIESSSDVHINPRGTITIFDPINSKIATIPLEIGNIFPDTSREFQTVWNQKWGWGRYKATLDLLYGNSGKKLSSTIYFWLFPIRLVIYSLVAIISVLTIIILLHRRSVRHQLELETEVRKLKNEIDRMVK